MARADPHLMFGCESALNVDDILLGKLEHIHHTYICYPVGLEIIYAVNPLHRDGCMTAPILIPNSGAGLLKNLLTIESALLHLFYCLVCTI